MNELNITAGPCTIKPDAPCASCTIRGAIACKWDARLLRGFQAISIPPSLIGFTAVAFSSWLIGTWWYLIGFALYFFAMLGVFEIRFLCSHCPYYAKDGRTLECIGNHGSFKFWRYHPEPMNRFERLMMRVLVNTLFIAVPLAVVLVGAGSVVRSQGLSPSPQLLALAGFAVAILASGLSFKSTLRRFYCSVCVNFSCPYNTVPKATVDSYLRRNPVMRAAWEASGYHLDEPGGTRG